ncbi:MAG: lysophospholipid acyltransferase family protein [Saprospiraceae bacterium]|nr:lysophospholipid acyltransferase family protein [Saprospiraceae bacterium]
MTSISSNQIQDRPKLTYVSETDPVLKKLLIWSVEYSTGRKKLEEIYHSIKDLQPEGAQIWDMVPEKLSFFLDYNADQLNKIPKEGPVIFVANHPFGVADGLVFGHLVNKVRPDFFFLVNEVLCREPLLDPYLLPVDFRKSAEALKRNIETKQNTVDRLRAGRSLAIFPAGGVSTSRRFYSKAYDLEWKFFTAKVARLSKATIVPFFFHGQNSRLFQIISQFSLTLRLGLLLNETRNKMGKRLQIGIGDPIPFEEYSHIKDRQQLTNFFKKKTYELGGIDNPPVVKKFKPKNKKDKK